MKIENEKYLPIKGTRGFVTNVDEADLKEDFFLRVRGGRSDRAGMVFERDFAIRQKASGTPQLGSGELVDLFTLSVPENNAEYDIAVVVNDGRTRIYVYDGGWVELTAWYSAQASSISTTSLGLQYVGDCDGNQPVDDGSYDFTGYVVYNLSRKNSSLIADGEVTVTNGATTVTMLNQPGYASEDGGLGWGVGDSILIFRETGILPDDAYKFTTTDDLRGYEFRNGTSPHVRWMGVDTQRKVNMYYGENSRAMRQPIQIRKGNRFVSGVVSLTSSGTGPTGGSWTELAGPIDPPYPGWLPDFSQIQYMEVSGTKYLWVVDGRTLYYCSKVGEEAWGAWALGGNLVGVLTSDITGLHMCSPTYGVLVELNGTVYKTENGGLSWWAVTKPSTYFYTYPGGYGKPIKCSISGGVLPMTIYVCGAVLSVDGTEWTGVVYKSTDTGVTWTASYSVVGNMLQAIDFVDGAPTTVVASGIHGFVGVSSWSNRALYIYTTNGGSTWTSLSNTLFDSLEEIEVPCIRLLSSTSAILATTVLYTPTGYSKPVIRIRFYKSVGGLTVTDFSQVFEFQVDGVYALDMDFADTLIGRITGIGIMAKTSDGGVTWTREPVANGEAYSCVGFCKGSAGTTNWMVAGPKILYYTAGTTGTKGDVQKGFGSAKGWTVQKAGLIPDFIEIGSTNDWKTGATNGAELNEGIKFKLDTTGADAAYAGFWYERIYITVLYAAYDFLSAYQESDPVAKFFVRAGSTAHFPQPKITISVDPAILNKNICGFNVYVASNDTTLLAAQNWVDDPNGYYLVRTVLFCDNKNLGMDVGWTFDATQRYCYSNIVENELLNTVVLEASSAVTILSALNHAPDLNRSYPKPRYAAKLARQQGSIIAIDESDSVLRFSTVDGFAVHQDDNFPDINVDNVGVRQKLSLLPNAGEMLGMVQHGEGTLVFKPFSVELVDLYSGVQRAIPADVLAMKSILNTPYGTVWGGNNAIYILPLGGGEIIPFNPEWKNFYDGSLVADNGSPYVTKAYREAMHSGYDPTYHEVWFALECLTDAGTASEQVVFRYNGDTKLWHRRSFVTGQTINTLRQSRDGMIVVLSEAICTYPDNSGSDKYRDVAGEGTGIHTDFTLHIGSLYSLSVNAALTSILIDHRSAGTGYFTVYFYANKETTPFDTKTYAVNARPVRRRIKSRSRVDELRIKVELTAAYRSTITQFDISQIELGYVPGARLGNK